MTSPRMRKRRARLRNRGDVASAVRAVAREEDQGRRNGLELVGVNMGKRIAS